MPSGTHLCFVFDGIHLADELAVGLEQEQQLEVQLVQAPAKLQLLEVSSRGAEVSPGLLFAALTRQHTSRETSQTC